MKQNKKTYFILSLLLMTMPLVFAVQGGDPEPPDPDSGAPFPGLPIDGGVIALLVAGVFYGVKKSLKKNK